MCGAKMYDKVHNESERQQKESSRIQKIKLSKTKNDTK